MKILYAILFLTSSLCFAQTAQVVDADSKEAVPFATISFGNGLGTFAGENGFFAFAKSKYKDVDTLFISSIGYAEKAIAVNNLPNKIYITVEADLLDEVIVAAPKRGPYKTKKEKATTHKDYFTSWLPTVESEVAVRFTRRDNKSTQITKLFLPVNAESKYGTKGKGNYATVFRIQFYRDANGLPGKPMIHEKIIFNIDQDTDKQYVLDITDSRIFIPKNGCYASLSVLGYADKNGVLQQSKKYSEVETRRGVKKISTTFRPLLPFSNKLKDRQTFVRRIFFNKKQWQVFDKTYNANSTLVRSGHVNYGMGAEFRVYKE